MSFRWIPGEGVDNGVSWVTLHHPTGDLIKEASQWVLARLGGREDGRWDFFPNWTVRPWVVVFAFSRETDRDVATLFKLTWGGR